MPQPLGQLGTGTKAGSADRSRAKPRGLAHAAAATRHSLAGLRRLWRETAFRHEAAGVGLALVLLLACGAPSWALAGQAVLGLGLFAVEALNTAIEELVDRLTTEWAEFARHAKDLGSLAVMCLLLANALWLAVALRGIWMG